MAKTGYVYFTAMAMTCAAYGCTSGASSQNARSLGQAATASAGSLSATLFHNVPSGTFTGDELSQMSSYANVTSPDYTFTDPSSDFIFDGNDYGGSGAPTATFLGKDASGAASSDTSDVANTIVDSKGFFVAPTTGSYHLHIGNTDDAAGIYLGGSGTSGSGTLALSNSYFSGNVADADVTLNAGSITLEILYGNGYGGAGLDGITITDPSGAQVAYTTSGSGGGAPVDAGAPVSPPVNGSGPAAGIYVLQNTAYSQALAVSQAQSYDGNQLVTYSVNNAPGQQFDAVPSGSGYLLEEEIAGRCLEVDGTTLTITTCNGAASQVFGLAVQGDGAYTVTASDGQCMHAEGSFTLVDASGCTGAADELWYFTPIGGAPVDAGAPVDSGSPVTDAGPPPPPPPPPPPTLGNLPQNFKLMTLGDSMTAGYGGADIGGYRGTLYQSLVSEGYSPQMVGQYDCGATSLLPSNEQQCDGVGGITIEATDARVLANGGLVATEDPDVILLLIGFNTVYYESSSISTDLGYLSKLVDDIMAQKPSARLVVASLIASTQCCGTDLISQYNAGVPGIVSAKASQGYPVSFLDLYPVVPPQDLYDYVHPNDTGYPLVANAWLGAINNIAR